MNYLPDCLRRGWCMISTRIAQWVGRKPESKTNLKIFFFGNLWFFCGSLSWFKGARGFWCHMHKVQLFSGFPDMEKDFFYFFACLDRKMRRFLPPIFPSSSHNPQFPIRSFFLVVVESTRGEIGKWNGAKKGGENEGCCCSVCLKRKSRELWKEF